MTPAAHQGGRVLCVGAPLLHDRRADAADTLSGFPAVHMSQGLVVCAAVCLLSTAGLVLHRLGDRPPAPRSSFAIHWTQRCEQSWRRAFMAFLLGIPALYINLAVAAWIKFDKSVAAAISTIVVLALSLVAMAFFHRKWTSHILETAISDPVRGREPSAMLTGCWHRAWESPAGAGGGKLLQV